MKTVRQFMFVLALMSFILASITYPAPVIASGDTIRTGETQGASHNLIAQGSPVFPLPSASNYGNIPAPDQNQSAQKQFQTLMWGIIQNVRYVIGAVAILFIVYSGFRMVTAYGNEEVYTKQRSTILYAIIGLAVVGLGGELARIFAVTCPEFTDPNLQNYTCTQGSSFLQDPNSIVRTSVIFNQRTKLIITFIKYFIGAVAIFEIISSGSKMITMGSDDAKIGKIKKNLTYAIVGLLLIIVSDTLINQVFYNIDLSRYPTTGGAQPGVNAAKGVQEIVGFTNLVVSFVGPIAVLVLIAGGVLYMTAAGDDAKMGKAKKLIFAALIGIIIIYGAFAIVSTFISGSFGNPAAGTVTPSATITT